MHRAHGENLVVICAFCSVFVHLLNEDVSAVGACGANKFEYSRRVLARCIDGVYWRRRYVHATNAERN